MGKQKSLKSKAVHFVSDLTTVFLNPISDKPSKPPLHHPTSTENVDEAKRNQLELIAEEDTTLADEPDTSSFTAFLYSLLSSSEGNDANLGEQNDIPAEKTDEPSENVVRESGGRRGLLSKGKQSLRALYQVAKLGGLRSQERRGDSQMKVADEEDDNLNGLEMKDMQNAEDPVSPGVLPGISEPSMLLSEKSRSNLYASLPALVQGRKWLLLYSTWRHGISLSTLYRRSMLWPGLSLLVVGDRKGAVFGGLVEAPLRPTNKRKYQGTNNTFVFTNTSGSPVIYRPTDERTSFKIDAEADGLPIHQFHAKHDAILLQCPVCQLNLASPNGNVETGANRYFTLCSIDFLAIGGGGHFALYLDGDLLSGSSAVSETYGNPCLAFSEDFEVKEVELWGFVYGSRYEEILGMSRTEAPGICRW